MALDTTTQQEISFVLADTSSLAIILNNEAARGADGLMSADAKSKINDNIEKFQDYLNSIIPEPVV